MAGKQYKNVYTILEKIKKGEIDSHYKNKDGLFGKIKFYKKPDLITPNLHYLDENRLDNIMTAHINNPDNIKDIYLSFQKTAKFRNIQDKPDINQFFKKVGDIYRDKFPKHLSKDIFKMYYNKMEKLEFEERTEKNYSKFKFLERSNNPVGKIMSESSQLKSAVFMKNIVAHYITQLAMLDYVDPQAANDMMNNLKGNSDEFSNDKVDDIMKSMLDDKSSKNLMEKALENAQNTCNQLDNAMTQEQQDQMFENCDSGSSEASKINSDYIQVVAKEIENIQLSLNSVKQKIKKLMDRSISYFSAKEETTYEDLFNADNIAGLDDYVLLHPKLRKVMIEDVTIKETKRVGKVDVYVDISGSMSSHCGVENNNGNQISKLDFCKSFVYKLKEMDLLNDLYTFENNVKHVDSDVITIAMLSEHGGTNINKVIDKINQNGINAIIITDAEDNCFKYSEKAFFIGVKGCSFHHFSNDVIQLYSEKDQAIMFDGNKIFKIDAEGKVVK